MNHHRLHIYKQMSYLFAKHCTICVSHKRALGFAVLNITGLLTAAAKNKVRGTIFSFARPSTRNALPAHTVDAV